MKMMMNNLIKKRNGRRGNMIWEFGSGTSVERSLILNAGQGLGLRLGVRIEVGIQDRGSLLMTGLGSRSENIFLRTKHALYL